MRESRPGVLASGVMVLRRWEIVNPGSSSISQILESPNSDTVAENGRRLCDEFGGGGWTHNIQ